MRNIVKLTFFVFVILTAMSTFAYSQNRATSNKKIASLCLSVKQIKELPHDRNEKGVDKTYDKLREAGVSVAPCLIDNIMNTKIMPDPRCPGISNATTIGDVSYFVLVDILNHLVEDFLPSYVQEAFKTNGVYAYHEYIDRPGARDELQRKLRNWFDSNRTKL